MALPTTDIFLRSPYWVTIEETDLDFVLCDLRVWTGNLVNEPVEADIKLRSTALNGVTSFDLAEFARDFVEVTFAGTAESNAVFISYQLQKFTGGVIDPLPPLETKVYLTGFDGYGLFQDGANSQWNKQVMISDSKVTVYNDTTISIPVKQNLLTGYKLQRYAGSYGGTLTTFYTVTGLFPTENTTNMVTQVATSYQSDYADRVVFEFNGQADEKVDISYAPCTKYGRTLIYFVNKLGATQTITFNGKSDVKMKTESNDYKRNIIQSNGSYDSTRHQRHVLNKNGSINLQINSGWISEEENDTIIELMLSEQVWIDVDAERLGRGWVPKTTSTWTIPVNIKSDETLIKNKLNDKLINYTFTFEAAYDWINTVR
tara:strand:+ start:2776 stop:3894 length:1119 start_codon:yes stop_codon:yes gene_type:complete